MRRVSYLSILLVLFAVNIASASEIGIMLRDIPDCRITDSDSSRFCKANSLISAGDVIVSSRIPADTDIQWITRDAVKLVQESPRHYRVTVAAPAAQKKGLLAIVGDLLGFARKAGRVSHNAVTRSGPERMPSLPGEGATLLAGEQVTFSWCNGNAPQLLLKNDKGQQIAAVTIPPGMQHVTVAVNTLGMKPGVIYNWELSGLSGIGGTIRLLGSDAAGIVADALHQLEQGRGAAAEKALKKAAFLNYLSSFYEKEYALGWLQYRLLQGLPTDLSKDDAAAAARLKDESRLTQCK